MKFRYLNKYSYKNTFTTINGKQCPIYYISYILREYKNSLPYLEIKYSYCEEGNILIPHVNSFPSTVRETQIIDNIHETYFGDTFNIRLNLKKPPYEFNELAELLIKVILKELDIDANKLEVENNI